MAKVLLFGALADVAGWRERKVEAQAVSDLRAALSRENPPLGEVLGRPGVQVALDKTLVRGDASLTAVTEVAFLPPMSGG